MTKAILWDNDGVLVDTEGLYHQANEIVFNELGRELSRDMYIDVSLKKGESVFDYFLTDKSPEEILEIRSRRNQIFSDLLERNSDRMLMPGAKEIVARMSHKFRMAIVTSCLKEHFKIIHRKTGLLKYFEFVLASGDYPKGKPHPDPYLAAMSRMALAPDECVVIEDTERGLSAAVAAGIRCVVVPHELTRYGDFSKAWKVLDDIMELDKILT